ncbi:OmpA-OmpF porin, OOP family [Mucilaginibacter mallensis]|uniref:OmpA-OmpF porin, OOP family n=1 Tax=Mucilaginibacter mallensis TaxID=652787 RepID=A0A1H1QIV6_MUCMA|nr:OmpA family protein [Mucilaginibacter mallensis]SDS23306.1 OmpA-OmpF porin, OOP family [Mucilaginibacter mallensis]
MKLLRSGIAPIVILMALITLQACKAKKLVQAPPPPPEAPAPVTPPPPPPAPAPQPTPPPPAPKPDYNFSNIQFEFNSGILKTDSYPALDNAAAQMKMDPTIKFNLSGFASAEGTDAHNMQLSIDRANSVKVYLVNSGVSADNITTKGYGEANPVADNSTEAGRILNRRVEIKKAN